RAFCTIYTSGGQNYKVAFFRAILGISVPESSSKTRCDTMEKKGEPAVPSTFRKRANEEASHEPFGESRTKAFVGHCPLAATLPALPDGSYFQGNVSNEPFLPRLRSAVSARGGILAGCDVLQLRSGGRDSRAALLPISVALAELAGFAR